MVNIVNVSSTETKWTWLEKRLAGAQAEVDAIAGQMQSLENTTFDGDCSGCGRHLETEADFAKHYIVRDPRYLNMGECPVVMGKAAAKEKVALEEAKAYNAAREKTYADVVGPYKDALYPNGI